MLSHIALACLIANPVQTQDPTMPDQIKEAFGKVVSIASDVQELIPSVTFRGGACLLGGSVREGGSFRYGALFGQTGDYAVVAGAYGNDSDIEVTVTDASGKSVVTSREEDGLDFEVKKTGAYTITAKNKGAHTFIALAVLQGTGGPKHPITSINTAVAHIAEGVKSSFLDGYSAPTNDVMVLGALIEPRSVHNRTANFNHRRWMVIGGSDAGVRGFSLSVTDNKSKEVFPGIEDQNYSYCDFEMVIPSATVGMRNTATKRILGMQAFVR
jgi:hypothetical protein